MPSSNTTAHSAASSLTSSDWEANPPPIFQSNWKHLLALDHRKRVSFTISGVFACISIVVLTLAMIFKDAKIANIILWSLLGACLFITFGSISCYYFYRMAVRKGFLKK